MSHSSEEVWASDGGCRGRVGDRTAHGPHAIGAILDYGPTGLYSQRWICYGSYSATTIQLNFDLLLPGVDL